jgi:hypothetical protein
MKRLMMAAMVCAVFVAAGCSSSTAPKVTVAGTWSGVTATQVLTVTLVESAGTVSGSGTLTNTPAGTLAETVSGSFVGSTVSLALTSGLHPAVNLTGTVAGNTMTGALQGSGFTGDAIVLTRAQ